MLHEPGKIEHVVIITIDGLRPDALDLAFTPTLDELRERGAYSPNAQTVIPSFTLPSHVSMLTGVIPQDHGIVEALPCIGCRLSIGPTLFNVAHSAGLSTGAVFGKEKLGYLVTDVSVVPGAVDQLFCADAHDPEVTEAAVEFIREDMPRLLFVHLPDVDRVGHEFGWMSENQMFAINFADSMIGEIVAALEEGDHLDNTLIIVSADHGGHGFKHGDDSPIDRTIPWLAVGPGVPKGAILNSPIATIDTAATAAYALNLPIPDRWDGQPVMEIFR
ncbi:MAG: alkaline phosphatase [Anaerolineae bacterium]